MLNSNFSNYQPKGNYASASHTHDDKQNKIIYRAVVITAPYGNTGIKISDYNLIGAIEANTGALAIPFANNGYYYIAIGTSSFTSVSSGTYEVALYLTQ